MKKLSKEKIQQLILTGLLTLIGLVFMWQVVMSWQDTKLKSLKQSLAQQENKERRATQLVHRAGQIEAELKQLQAELQAKESTMPSGDLYSWFILTINRFRAGYDVNIPDISREQRGPVKLVPNFPYQAATFTVRGGAFYHDLGKFVADFENRFPFMRIENLDIKPSGPTNIAERLSFRMDLVSLIRPSHNE